jgi:2-(1,2-epoxy-1,2-dihydrophenyl)acetyl-CoA isomerase
MTEPTVLYQERGAVALITLNRPQALNSFTRQMHQDLWAALDKAEADPAVRALVITGAGRGFCAGRRPGGVRLCARPGPGARVPTPAR